ncbi:MAG TPA: hypothetical protein VMM13_19135 [Euzebya sp.]|nr:hypothetical protein [Euzebya sp.]
MMPPPDYTLIMNHLAEIQRLASDGRGARSRRTVAGPGRRGVAAPRRMARLRDAMPRFRRPASMRGQQLR